MEYKNICGTGDEFERYVCISLFERAVDFDQDLEAFESLLETCIRAGNLLAENLDSIFLNRILEQILRLCYSLQSENLPLIETFLRTPFQGNCWTLKRFAAVYFKQIGQDSTLFLRYYLEICKNLRFDFFFFWPQKHLSECVSLKWKQSFLAFLTHVAILDRTNDIRILASYGCDLELVFSSSYKHAENGCASNRQGFSSTRFSTTMLLNVLVRDIYLEEDTLRTLLVTLFRIKTRPWPTVMELRNEFALQRNQDTRCCDSNDSYFSTSDRDQDEILCQLYERLCPVLPTVASVSLTLEERCRLKVRRNLNNSWNLPDGIIALPLPMLVNAELQLLI